MRKWLIVLAALAVAALMAVPALAGANNGSAHKDAQKQCRAERNVMGKQTFKDTYGTNKNKSNAFGKCVSHRTRQNKKTEAKSMDNAEQSCTKDEQSDPTGFADQYGKGHNAHGKCVSARSKARTKSVEHKQVKAEENAAKTCKSERKQDPNAFKDKYGTNKNKSNAFGKCVSQHSKSKEKQDGTQS